METALGGYDIRPTAVCVGIAGVDRENDAHTVNAIMRRISRGSRVLVVNDALVALEAAVPGAAASSSSADGIDCYGRSAPGRRALRGWGHVIGDEGAFWIGQQASWR